MDRLEGGREELLFGVSWEEDEDVVVSWMCCGCDVLEGGLLLPVRPREEEESEGEAVVRGHSGEEGGEGLIVPPGCTGGVG